MRKLSGIVLGVLMVGAIGFGASGQIQDAVVSHGSATFNTAGLHTTIEAADHTIINYSRFDIPVDHSVQFVQPGFDATVFNRINAAEPTRIDGSVTANGRVYFLNPSGVVFGGGAVINATQFFAIGSHLSDGQLLTNPLDFGNLTGVIENHGSITAEAVHLIGSRVINRGIILGDNVVTMAAGSRVMLSEQGSYISVVVEGVDAASGEPGVDVGGTIKAVNGKVTLAAGDMLAVALRTGAEVEAVDIAIRSGAQMIEEGGMFTAVNIVIDAVDGVDGNTPATTITADSGGGSSIDTGNTTTGGTATAGSGGSSGSDEDSESADVVAASSAIVDGELGGVVVGGSRELSAVATQPALSEKVVAQMAWRRLGEQNPDRFINDEANELIAELFEASETEGEELNAEAVVLSLREDSTKAGALELLRGIRTVLEGVRRPGGLSEDEMKRDVKAALGAMTPRGVTAGDLMAVLDQVDL